MPSARPTATSPSSSTSRYAYRPHEFLHAYDRVDEAGRIPEVAAHLEEIAAIDDSIAYEEPAPLGDARPELPALLARQRLRVTEA